MEDTRSNEAAEAVRREYELTGVVPSSIGCPTSWLPHIAALRAKERAAKIEGAKKRKVLRRRFEKDRAHRAGVEVAVRAGLPVMPAMSAQPRPGPRLPKDLDEPAAGPVETQAPDGANLAKVSRMPLPKPAKEQE